MTQCLITPSLLNSYAYYIQDEYKSPADSRADFLRTVSRERFEPNEAMQKGIDFENDIADLCKGLYRFYDFGCKNEDGSVKEVLQYEMILKSIGDIIKGGLWQQSVKKEIMVGNQEFLLYGRTDAIKRDTIYDIKFTTNKSNYDTGKYIKSAQHRIYLYCTDMPKFQYLISDGKEFWVEDYHNHAGIEGELKGMISDFMGYLENDKEAKEMFLTKWKANDKH